MSTPGKRPKLESCGERKKDVVLFIAPQKINKMRLDKMKETASKNGFLVVQTFSYNVTHVVTETDTKEQVLRNLNIDETQWERHHEIVNTSWFSVSVKAGHPVEVCDKYRVKQMECSPQLKDTEVSQEVSDFILPDYACQRSALLKHHNHKFTDALEILELHAELRNDPTVKDQTRALAFRRAAAVLKSLPQTLAHRSDLRSLKGIGSHAEAVIKEIIEDGYSAEVESISSSEQFKTLRLFDGVFGIGPSTANKWVSQGHRSVEDIIGSADAVRKNDKRVQFGLAFYQDLNSPVPRSEADTIRDIVRAEVNRILPGATVELTGGFRRDKPCGHDVDLLISHPEVDKEKGLLAQLLDALHSKNFILFGKHESHSSTNTVASESTMDDFEKWIGIVKLPCGESVGENLHCDGSGRDCELGDLLLLARSNRDWVARRVDLVIAPINQYYYALVGWTGSKHFNRSLRLYAQRELNMRLTSHGLYSPGQSKSLESTSERQVFEHLKLQYREPWERNC